MSPTNPQSNPFRRWRKEQPGRLTEEWSEFMQNNPDRAYQFINDPTLEFPAIYLLKDELNNRSNELDPRVQIAVAQIRNVLNGADIGTQQKKSFPDQQDLVVHSLSWVLKTGWNCLLSTDYNQVIDQTAIQLLRTYHLANYKEMTDLIFYRYKNKSQRHYLISTLLETADPRFLICIANYLLSNQTVENNFARKMLAFIPEVHHAPDQLTAFLSFESWYEANEHYLVYTGETNDARPGGVPFRIHYSAKYLGKPVSPATGQPVQALLPAEKENYQKFIRLSNQLQISLAEYSANLRRGQLPIWKRWIVQPLGNQIDFLRKGSGNE